MDVANSVGRIETTKESIAQKSSNDKEILESAKINKNIASCTTRFIPKLYICLRIQFFVFFQSLY